jgi:ABC-type lipoprotein export system ATPase subunit
MAGVRLKWLKIEKYRNVAPGTELHFSDKFNVLLGKNGTGKTTLLRLIAMIAKDGFAPLAERSFDLSFSLAFQGVNADVQVRNERRKPESTREMSYFVWSYDILFQFEGDPDGYGIKASPDGGELTYKVDGKLSQHAPSHPLPPPFADRFLQALLARFDVEGRLPFAKHNAMQGAWAAMFNARGGRFDEGLGAFAALTEFDAGSAKPDLRAANVTVVADSSGKMLSGGLTFAPDEIWSAMASKPLDETMPLRHHDLGFLQKTVTAMGFKDAEMLMRRRRRTVDKPSAEQTVSYGGFEFNFTLQDGEIIRHEDLSYGQKRLLSFLYYAACNPDIIIADELVNGLHHDWAQLCLDEIAERQSFLAGQDPLLFDFLFFESEEEVRQSFILCSLEQLDGRGHFVWKNLSPESAAAFYRAYQAGIQHVSEILYSKGLW